MLIALHVGQISFSQDYFKLLSVRKLIQVEMLYPGSVVPLAMFLLLASLTVGQLNLFGFHKNVYFWVVLWFVEVGTGDPTPPLLGTPY